VAHRALMRGAAIAVSVAIGMTSGIGPVGAAPAAVDPAPAHTVFQADRYVPRGSSMISAGASGFLQRVDGTPGYLWTRYSDRQSVTVDGLVSAGTYPGYAGAGSDTVAVRKGGGVELRGMHDGSVRQLPLSTGSYLGTYGETVVTYAAASDTYVADLKLHRFASDGSVEVRDVALPATARVEKTPLAADARTVVLRYWDSSVSPARPHLGLLDIATGTFTVGPEGPGGSILDARAALGRDLIAWYSPGNPIRVVPRDNPGAEPEIRALSAGEGSVRLGIAGDWVVVARALVSQPQDSRNVRGMPLVAVPPGGAAPVRLLTHADNELVQTPDGGLLVTGGPDSAHWSVRRLSGGSGGGPIFTTDLVGVPPEPATIRHLSLANGTLATDEADSGFGGTFVSRSVTTAGTKLSVGEPVTMGWSDYGAGPWSAGDGRMIRTMPLSDETNFDSLDKNDSAGFFRVPSGNATVLDITGRYAVVNGANPAMQYVGDLGVYTDLMPIRTRPVTAASVWGSILWSPSATAGVLAAENLQTGAKSTLATGAPCVAKDLQAVGRWIYWSCGPTGQAGVWDRTARKNIPVPSGEALIGDGYLVRHDKAAGKLLLTAFQDGTADVTRTVGDLPGTAVNKRGVTWTVDKFGGPVAYVASDKRVHLAHSGVPTERVSALEATASTLVTVGGASWSGRWLVSKPVSGWQVTVRSAATGTVVRTLSGTAPRGVIEAYWDGRTATGGYLPNGSYTFALTATPADGQGPAFTASGPVALRKGAPVRHDHVGTLPDGIGDLLTLNGAGDFTFHRGDSGMLSGKTTGSGWSTSALAVPFGDVSGDRCNDVLIRLGTGELRAYRPGCGKPLDAEAVYTRVGTGWGQYNVLTSPGDMNGDGRADLVARHKDTGDLFFYAGLDGGGFAARVLIGTNWKAYTKVVGVGDITGDGRPDLLAHDANGGLWRYEGAGNGMFKARVQVFSGWGRGYNALVGVGDITGDGKADLVARDTAGGLYRHNGTGTGTFAGSVRIGAGWQSYKLY
jgi:hypothetical protein